MARNYMEPGVYRIVNEASGTVIDLSAGDNKTVIGWTKNSGNNQLWRISEPDALENQTIENVGKPGTYLSLISGGSIVDSTLLQGNPNEFRWAIRRDEQFGDKWRMFVPNTCHNVDLSDNGNANNGTMLQIWGKWDGKNQLWQFKGPNEN